LNSRDKVHNLVNNNISSKLFVNSPPRANVTAKGDSGASHHYWRKADVKCLDNVQPNNSINVTLPNSQSISSTIQGTLPLSNELTPKARTAVVLPNLTSSSLISLGQLCDDGCNINLDKEKMQVCKNNKLIIQGNRNKTDGLWDIPIHDNYILPKPLGVYKTTTQATHKSPSFLQHINSISKQPTKVLNHSIPTKIPTFIQNMNPIVEDNAFDQILQEHNKLNVIIRKRQTKQQLATYLHATCLSPTPRTFIQAIKQNNFIT